MIKNQIVYTSGTDWVFNLKKAQSSYLWDSEGKKYLDFTSGWNVANLGWNNKEILEAVIKQAGKNAHSTLDTSEATQIELAKKLTSYLPKQLDTIGKATGGTEANEEALKTARAYTKRTKIIGFRETYHGQSFADMAVGYPSEYTGAIAPLLPDVVQIEYPNTYRTGLSQEELLEQFKGSLEKILSKEDIAAIVTEAGIITGWGTTYVAPDGYLKTVRELTKKYGTLLILDEVGTGFSRCGKLFGMEIEGIVPDIATFAKGLSNGVAAIGAMVTSREIAEKTWKYTNLTSTFGWVPLACAAVLKVLEIHNRDKVWEKSEKDGRHIREVLKRELTSHPFVGDIRGKGMEIGVDLVKSKKTKKENTEFLNKTLVKARKNGLFLDSDGTSNIQLMPPLTMDREDLNKGLQILIEAIKNSN